MLLRSPLLEAVPGLAHGFTTARGPDLARGASPEAWAEVARAVGMPGGGVAYASQVHGDRVLRAARPGLVGECDALVTDRPGLLVAVRVADCVPILVAGTGAVAAIHAGWRGVAAGVVSAAIDALRSLDGGPLVAVVGPCISAEAYEVGDEVIAGIASAGVPEDVFVRSGSRRPHVDLRAAVAWQLRRGGVDQVEVLPDCTFSDPLLHSHRRDAAGAGRLAAVIGRSP